MNISIFGYGFVGKAHALALEGNSIKTHVYDPALGFDQLHDNPDAAIIAVSTPQKEDGSCDMYNVYNALSLIPEDVRVLIKSTISLEGWRTIKNEYPNRAITFSPEYLRAAYALEDFKNQDLVYIGDGDTYFWEDLISDALNIQVVSVYSAEELILSKYFINSFLATKVSFFNQIYDLCKTAEIDPDVVCTLVAEDKRIGDSHSYVTEERGFGGHCFPKDTSAIAFTGQNFNSPLTIIESAIKYNNELKNESRNNI